MSRRFGGLCIIAGLVLWGAAFVAQNWSAFVIGCFLLAGGGVMVKNP
jgi:uncharacterized membrane protein HdeD (DUF308 family)